MKIEIPPEYQHDLGPVRERVWRHTRNYRFSVSGGHVYLDMEINPKYSIITDPEEYMRIRLSEIGITPLD